MAVSKECIGLAAEFAVASELCRRGIYGQLTFGNRKRVDILVISEHNRFTRIEVKAKQGTTWPNCKGIYGDEVFLVLVDFSSRNDSERPDFYILNSKDWLEVVKKEIRRLKEKNPGINIKIDSESVPVWVDKIGKDGKAYRGMGISPKMIQEHREAWRKITKHQMSALDPHS